MNKRGVTQHIEMIIATVLFIFFFVFILLLVKPYESNVLSESLIDGIKYEINENCTVNVIQLFVNVGSFQGNIFCFKIPTYLEVLGKNCVAFDLNGVDYSCSVADKVCVQASLNGGYNILFSDDLDSKELNENDVIVSFGGNSEREMFSYSKLIELNESYYNNYDNVKKQLGLPLSYDFSFSSSIVNMTRAVPEDVEVLGREFVKAVIYNNGTIINERFLIRVW